MLRQLALSVPLAVLVACGDPTAVALSKPAGRAVNADGIVSASTAQTQREAPPAAGDCSFSQGVTTCTSTSQYQETNTRTVYGGCVAGPTGVPGRSVTVYEDTWLVTAVTTTDYRGASDKVIQSNTVTTRELVNSVQISRTCEAL